jgi:hypothetical protein
MTKKDFELIARAIREAPIEGSAYGAHAHDVRAGLADHFAGLLAEGNPRFDRELFVAAAAPEPRAMWRGESLPLSEARAAFREHNRELRGPLCEECDEPLGDEPVVRHETGDYHARCAEADPTEAQRVAIEAQARAYSGPETPCEGLDGYTVERASAWEWDEAKPYPDDAVAVQFRYVGERHSDEEQEHHGLEVTIFDRDGKVIDSQDFG